MDYFVALVSLVTFAALARVVMFRGPMATPTPPPRGLIDMHCHTAGIGAGGSGLRISEKLRGSWKFPLYLRIFETNLEELNLWGDSMVLEKIAHRIRQSEYVDGAVVVALDAPYSAEGELDLSSAELYVPNRWAGETLKDFPNLHFGASVHPNRPDALEELQWSKDNGAVLIKWLPNIQNIDPSDRRHKPFYDKLVELDLPLLTHVGAEDSFVNANNRLGDPRLLQLALECGVRVIAAHVASAGETDGQENFERLLEMLPRYPSLMADISTLTQINRHKYLPLVLSDDRLKGRLMYGTDHPLTNTLLVTALQFPLRLTLRQIWEIHRTENPWNRDVKLKAALGVPPEVFLMSREYLGL